MFHFQQIDSLSNSYKRPQPKRCIVQPETPIIPPLSLSVPISPKPVQIAAGPSRLPAITGGRWGSSYVTMYGGGANGEGL